LQIVTFIGLAASQAEKAELPLQLEKAISTPPLVSIGATGVGIPIGNGKVLLQALYKSPGHSWNDANILEPMKFRGKSLLA
jgi:hypothetical protein